MVSPLVSPMVMHLVDSTDSWTVDRVLLFRSMASIGDAIISLHYLENDGRAPSHSTEDAHGDHR